jgi:hypothetical protein
MDVTGAGTAVMIAIAAALWFAYFVPTWMRRREYLDTERTATRLQQTLRVMAETAELPDQVRIEVSARDAGRQERLLRAEQRRADAVAAAEVARVRQSTPHADSDPRLRRRRAHRLASVLMIAATVTLGLQLWVMVIGAAGAATWLVLAGGVVLGVAGVAARRRIDARSIPITAGSRTTAPVEERVVARPAAREWTPVPVPAPLYVSRPRVQRVHPTLDLAAQARATALQSERAAHEAPEVIPFRRTRPAPVEVPAPRAAPSRWAAMGRVEGQDAAAPDLDEVLRRRRNAG